MRGITVTYIIVSRGTDVQSTDVKRNTINRRYEMTNTERLINDLMFNISNGINYVDFWVGKYTGNNPSVINALRNRGYKVNRLFTSKGSLYRLEY